MIKKILGGNKFQDESLTTLSVYLRRKGGIRAIIAKIILWVNNVEIPLQVVLGENIRFVHNAYGTVIHPNTTIEDNVLIYQNVTIGRADCFRHYSLSKFKGVVLKKGCCICPGAKIICNKGELVVGSNTVIGANAVLTQSTGDNEIWAGVPAKFIKKREDCDPIC